MSEGRNGKDWKLNSNQLEIRFDMSSKSLEILEKRAVARLNYFTNRFNQVDKMIKSKKEKKITVYGDLREDFMIVKDRKAFWTYRLEQIHLILTERILLEENTDSI